MSTWTSVIPEMLCSPKECYVAGATSHLQTLTHFYLKELLWQSNPGAVGPLSCVPSWASLFRFKAFGGQGKVTPLSLGNPPSFFWHCGLGSGVSQLLPWCLWDVSPAVLLFPELGLHILRQNTHIPDVREDFTFFQLVPHSQEPPVCLSFSDFLASCLPWTFVSIHGPKTGLCHPVPPDCCRLVYCSVFILPACESPRL